MGFGAPLGAWFRSDLSALRARAPARPAEPALRVPASPTPVARLVVDAHGADRADLSPQIWALLTLESWLRQEGGWRPSL